MKLRSMSVDEFSAGNIKLALDAADAATDVTSEYSQVKREHIKAGRVKCLKFINTPLSLL